MEVIVVYIIGASIWGLTFEFLHKTLNDNSDGEVKEIEIEFKVFNFLFWPIPFILFLYGFFKQL